MRTPLFSLIASFGAALLTAHPSAVAEEAPSPDGALSYYRDIRPIFQASCHGCHQPAKAKGKYIMTEFSALVKGGDGGEPAIVPGKPDESFLVEQITPHDGKAEMPPKDDPLAGPEIEKIRAWIAQGAADDTPENAGQPYTMESPPKYERLPVVTSLDYSPDGSLLAASGFHEVILHRADGSGIEARLVGLSERVESVRFSPDGKWLAVTGGSPGRMGEVQVWDVAKRELDLSVTQTFDTLYGASWAPDGSKIAFGGADTVLRAIDAKNGKEVLFQGAHDDWVFDTVWSVKGDFVVSVGRDMTAKLIEFETARFVDNITSITPKALKGGLAAVARHPERDEILVGGADGEPKVYRMQRLVKRVIGDDSNLIRKFPPMVGRIFAVDYAPDGKRIAAGSSLDGKGAIHLYSADFDPALPDDIKGIFGKVITSRNAGEVKKTEDYWTKDATQTAALPMPAGIYALTFSPDGKTVAASGGDGIIRLIDAAEGKVRREFPAVPLEQAAAN